MNLRILLMLRRDRPRAIDRFIDYFGEGARSRGRSVGARHRPFRRRTRSR
jgi:hypothetical protein